MLTLCFNRTGRLSDHLAPMSGAHGGMMIGVFTGATLSMLALAAMARSALAPGLCAITAALLGMIAAMQLVNVVSLSPLAPIWTPAIALAVTVVAMTTGHWAGLRLLNGIVSWSARRSGGR